MSHTETDRDLIILMAAVCREGMSLAAAVQRSGAVRAPLAYEAELERLVEAASRLALHDARAGNVIDRLPDLASALAEIRAEDDDEPDEADDDPLRPIERTP